MKPLRWIGAFFSGFTQSPSWPDELRVTEAALLCVGLAALFMFVAMGSNLGQ
jgi:hypothetical protein